MGYVRAMIPRRSAALTLITLALAGCQPGSLIETAGLNTAVLGESVAIDGKALAPARLVSDSGSGLIANNGGGLIANNGGGIVASNSARFRLQALDEVPLANALAYLTDPKEQFYRVNGKMVQTTTDSQGRYHFSVGVPKGQPVLLNAILPGNRRVVGFTVPALGTNKLDVSLATTYVTEFLRARAEAYGKSMSDYDLGRLPDLARRTEKALDAQTLAPPDLAIGHLADMTMGYAAVVGQNVEGLGDAWATMLGKRTLAALTVAGTGVSDDSGDGKPAVKAEFYRLKGVCKDRQGNLYLADEGNHRVRKIDGKNGLISTVAGTGDPGYAGDGGPAVQAMLNHPRAVILDAAEANLVIFDSQNVRVRKVELATGTITTIAGDPVARGEGFWENGHAGDGGPAVKAKLFSPRGGAFDAQGNLYVVDGLKGTRFHTIRKISPSGIISTIAGVPDEPGGFVGENVPAEEAHLNYTNQIWITPDDQLYMADTFNDVIRKIDLRTNLITTIAGVPGRHADAPEPDGKPARETALNSPYGVAVDAKGQIFIGERGHRRILVVKPDGKLWTVAGGGGLVADGDARRTTFSEPHDLWAESDGNLLVADSRAAKLRRIITKFGI